VSELDCAPTPLPPFTPRERWGSRSAQPDEVPGTASTLVKGLAPEGPSDVKRVARAGLLDRRAPAPRRDEVVRILASDEPPPPPPVVLMGRGREGVIASAEKEEMEEEVEEVTPPAGSITNDVGVATPETMRGIPPKEEPEVVRDAP
jgi:hypothetical protein